MEVAEVVPNHAYIISGSTRCVVYKNVSRKGLSSMKLLNEAVE